MSAPPLVPTLSFVRFSFSCSPSHAAVTPESSILAVPGCVPGRRPEEGLLVSRQVSDRCEENPGYSRRHSAEDLEGWSVVDVLEYGLLAMPDSGSWAGQCGVGGLPGQ